MAGSRHGIRLEDGLVRDCCSGKDIHQDGDACYSSVQVPNLAMQTYFSELVKVSILASHYSSTARLLSVAAPHGYYCLSWLELLQSLLRLLLQCQYDDSGDGSGWYDE